jgi:methionyl-tRNA formyltransferase
LRAVLLHHNPKLELYAAETLAELEALDRSTLARARLISFTNGVIVPQRILDALGYGAYNFHPGPPNYPGFAPAVFAIYDRSPVFGVTVHEMAEKVDAGPIVGLNMFNTSPDMSVMRLEQIALLQLAHLFWTMARVIATQTEALEVLPVTWSGRKTTRRMFEHMCEIPPNITPSELDRRVAAFGGGFFGQGLTLRLHNYAFRYAEPPAAEAEGIDGLAPALDKTDVADMSERSSQLMATTT